MASSSCFSSSSVVVHLELDCLASERAHMHKAELVVAGHLEDCGGLGRLQFLAVRSAGLSVAGVRREAALLRQGKWSK